MSTLINTSSMLPGQRAAMEMTEMAREEQDNQGFVASIFMGRPDFLKIFPFPEPSIEDRDQGDAFIAQLHQVLEEYSDPDLTDETGELPDVLLQALARIGAFGIKIPTKYGGLGLSQNNYSRAATELGKHCGSLTALISAHQSIGVPQPLLVFGNEAQKEKYLRRCAQGEISAFALTEPEVGSDPARMKTSAELSADGTYYRLNGVKLWCTNGTRAGLIVVMAKTPLPDKPHATTAFIVESDWEGVVVRNRCHFMGLKALYNAVIEFRNVKVPVENVIGKVGMGLKIALTTLNTGRITLPAACAGLSERLLDITRRWAKERVQWGKSIWKHEAVGEKIARMAADTFAMHAVTQYVSTLVDEGKKQGLPVDVRLEAAIAKLWCTEGAWKIADDAMQIRGGRGYETAASQLERGERPEPVERLFRDARINTIFEGSSEIMRLLIAREALDPHLKLAGEGINPGLPMMRRIKSLLKAAGFYVGWYPALWIPRRISVGQNHPLHPEIRAGLRDIERASRRLARTLFVAMAIKGPKLESSQRLLGQFVDIGSEIFVMSVVLAQVQSQLDKDETLHDGQERNRLLSMVAYFREKSMRTIRSGFRTLSFTKETHTKRWLNLLMEGS